MTEPLPLLLDSREACKILFGSNARKNKYRLYAMIDRKEIAAKKIGDRWFIPGKAMQRFIDDQPGQNEDPAAVMQQFRSSVKGFD